MALSSGQVAELLPSSTLQLLGKLVQLAADGHHAQLCTQNRHLTYRRTTI